MNQSRTGLAALLLLPLALLLSACYTGDADGQSGTNESTERLPANAGAATAPRPSPSTGPTRTPLETDARMYAEDNGVSVDEAVRRFELREEAAEQEIGPRLQQAAGDRYAGHWIQHQPDYGYVLLLAGEGPPSAELQEIADASPMPVSFRSGAASTHEELQEIRDNLIASLGEPGRYMGHGLDVQQNAINLYAMSYSPLARDPEATEARLATEFGVNVIIDVHEPRGPIFPPDAPTGPLALYHAGPARPQAGHGGTLRITDECVYTENERGERTVLAFPYRETGWDPDTRTITLQGVEIQDGDEVFFGGAGFDPDSLDSADWPSRTAASCNAERGFRVGGAGPDMR